MGANPHANGGLLLHDLRMPDFRDCDLKTRGETGPGDMLALGTFMRDIIKLNLDKINFRVYGPDETLSNKLNAVFEVTTRQWEAPIIDTDEFFEKGGPRNRNVERAPM
jgi:xylulose-5-phosphate/fructose-6-phosphate phosphoketolase